MAIHAEFFVFFLHQAIRVKPLGTDRAVSIIFSLSLFIVLVKGSKLLGVRPWLE